MASGVGRGKEGKCSCSIALTDRESEQLRQFLYTEGALNLPRSETERILARRLGEGAAPIRNKIEALNWTHPGAPPRAMALVDRAQPRNSHVLLRGNPGNPGPEAPRRFLEVLSATEPPAFTNGSGRVDLARAIAGQNNPLTARVREPRGCIILARVLSRRPAILGCGQKSRCTEPSWTTWRRPLSKMGGARNICIA
jgi:hypothetical protein